MGSQAQNGRQAVSAQVAAPSSSGVAGNVVTQPRGNQAAAEGLGGGGMSTPDQIALNSALMLTLEQRETAIQRLGVDVEAEDAPPLWQGVALSVCMIALSAATAGVGTAVAGALTGAVAAAGVTAASAATAEVVTEMVSTATEESLNTGIAAILAQPPPATNVKDQFFRAQEDAVAEMSANAMNPLAGAVRAQVDASEDPAGTAAALIEAFEAGRAVAMDRQREASLASWCNFLARTELGESSSRGRIGVDLEEQVGDTSGKGVLGVRVAIAGDAPHLEIVDAEIEGLNETLRGELASRPIGELGVSVTVHGEGMRLGENEAGRRWNESTDAGKRWLANRAAGEEIPDEDWEALGPLGRFDLIQEGAERSLEDDIKPQSLGSVGVKLDG